MTPVAPGVGMGRGRAALPVTLGLIAGGRGTRLGGVDKAWLLRDGQPQVARLAGAFDGIAEVLVSSNSHDPRYAALGFHTVRDAAVGWGPIAGLSELAARCRTPWLMTLPVDVLDPSPELPGWLLAAARQDPGVPGIVVQDDGGLQPLVALWRREVLAEHARRALDAGRLAVRDLVAVAGLATLPLPGRRLGNLNTLGDLHAAHVVLPQG
ncbi:molybdenum cofactor guanylyltransferase [Lysobacter sp. A3-1-A15]|uniref:molybdenum cofactor guanylyltransferase n=1 Tax=Novilysobacter viscosus TaxID=3098602 RepID=UPI002EDACA15